MRPAAPSFQEKFQPPRGSTSAQELMALPTGIHLLTIRIPGFFMSWRSKGVTSFFPAPGNSIRVKLFTIPVLNVRLTNTRKKFCWRFLWQMGNRYGAIPKSDAETRQVAH